MSHAKPPPIPPANQTPFGPGAASPEGDMSESAAEGTKEGTTRNLDQQGRQGNVAQNTRNQGYRQDR